MPEMNEVSEHLLRIYQVFALEPDRWFTNVDVATEVKARGQRVGDRTVRAHTLRLVQAGVLDQAEVFPRHRYRLSPKARQRNRGFMQRLAEAADICGVPLSA